MASSICSHCGASIPADASFCQYCGVAVGTMPSSPLPSAAGTPLGPTASSPGSGAPPSAILDESPPPKRKSHRLLIVVAVVVVLILVLSVVLYAFLVPTTPTVEVDYILDWAPDNVCNLTAQNVAYYGFNASAGSSQAFEFQVPNTNSTACTVERVTTNTTGFSLSDVEVPLTIPGNSSYVDLNLTINVPNSGFNGNLNLVFA